MRWMMAKDVLWLTCLSLSLSLSLKRPPLHWSKLGKLIFDVVVVLLLLLWTSVLRIAQFVEPVSVAS